MLLGMGYLADGPVVAFRYFQKLLKQAVDEFNRKADASTCTIA